MKIHKLIFLLLILSTSVFSQNQSWKNSLNKTLSEFKSCMSTESKLKCDGYTSLAIRQVYNIKEFKNKADQSDMSPYEIQQYVSKSSEWVKLGPAYNSETLIKAQQLSNEGKPVIVVLEDESQADVHVSVVLPGELQSSGSWGMKVPSVSAFFTHNPGNSFVDKSISYAYTKSMMLRLQVYTKK